MLKIIRKVLRKIKAKVAKKAAPIVWEWMVPGGIVVFDGYGFICPKGVTKLCEELRDVKDGIFVLI